MHTLKSVLRRKKETKKKKKTTMLIKRIKCKQNLFNYAKLIFRTCKYFIIPKYIHIYNICKENRHRAFTYPHLCTYVHTYCEYYIMYCKIFIYFEYICKLFNFFFVFAFSTS